MNNALIHLPIMVDDVVAEWQNQKKGIFFDCTFGRGGHSKKLLENLAADAKLYGLDVDENAVEIGKQLSLVDNRFQIIKANFQSLETIWKKLEIPKIDGILFDLGVSSPQFDDPSRGFSYKLDYKLDMRMDLDLKIDAHFIVNNFSVNELTKIFRDYGDSIYAHKIAHVIVKQRQIKPIDTTLELAELIKNNLPKQLQFQKKHPARVFFQALRIKVNEEIHVIKKMLDQLENVVNTNGKVVFITFHSLEEKLVKNWMKKVCNPISLPGVPVIIPNKFTFLPKKTKKPSIQEIELNNRARSAKMWVFVKN